MHVALYENLPSGGSKREAYELAKALTEHGHVVDLWTTTAADSHFLSFDKVTRKQFRYPWPGTRRVPSRLQWSYIRAAVLNEWLVRIEQVARQMAADIDQAQYDFVFVHHCQPVQGPYLLRTLQTPSVYFCHEPMRIYYDPPIRRLDDHWTPSFGERWRAYCNGPAQRMVDEVRKRDDAINARRASILLTSSYFGAESVYRAYNRRAYVSYMGVDVDKFRPLGLSRDDYVLSVGAIRSHKGYDFLVRALGCVPRARRPKLVIVGNASSSDEYSYLKNLACQHSVLLDVHESVTDHQLVELYNRARAFVYAPVLEPFGFAPLEAMACGTPVVAVAEGGVRESVQDSMTGLLAQREPHDFAHVLLSVLDDEDLQNRLATSALERVRSFWTWDSAYQRFLHWVEMTLNHGRL